MTVRVFVAQIVNTLRPWKQAPAFFQEGDGRVEASTFLAGQNQGADVQLMTLQGAKILEV